MLKRAYRTRRGAFGIKSKKKVLSNTNNNKDKDVVELESATRSRLSPQDVPNHRHVIDVGQSKGKPTRLLGMNVAYDLNLKQTGRLTTKRMRASGVLGYKITMPGGIATNGFKFKPGHRYKHKGHVCMCSSGFHFSISPLQALSYARLAYDTLPSNLELYPVLAVGPDIIVGTDKVVARELCIGNVCMHKTLNN